MKRWFFFLLCTIVSWISWAQYTPPVADKNEMDSAEVLDESALSYEACMSRAVATLVSSDSLAVAQRYLELALRKAPNAPSNHVVHELLGRIFLQRNQPKDALRAYNEALRLKPTYLPALEQRAQLYTAQGNLDAAYADYSAMLTEIAPSEAEYLKQILIARAGISIIQQQWNLATADLERVLRTEPRDLETNLLLAFVHQKMGRDEEAKMRLDVMVETYPKEVSCLTMRAHFACLRKEYDVAIDDFNAALAIEPKNAAIFAQRAAVYAQQGRHRAARLDREQAQKLGLSPEEIELYNFFSP